MGAIAEWPNPGQVLNRPVPVPGVRPREFIRLDFRSPPGTAEELEAEIHAPGARAIERVPGASVYERYFDGLAEMHRIAPGTYLSILDGVAVEEFVEKQIVRESVALHFGEISDYTQLFGRYFLVQNKSPRFTVVTYPRQMELTRWVRRGAFQRSVAITLRPGVIADFFGADLAAYPEEVQALAAGTAGSRPFFQTLPLTPPMRRALTDLCACDMSGRMREIFIESVGRTLLCAGLERIRQFAEDRSAGVTALDESLQSKCDRVRELLERSYHSPPTIAELGRLVGLNRSKLAAAFKSAFGVTIHRFCLNLRLEEAERLLIGGNTSISQIAYQVGYENPASLTRAFRQHLGYSPTDRRLRATTRPDASESSAPPRG